MNFHFIDDRWVITEDLKLSVFDLSVLRGYGIFDFLRTYDRQPFRLREHLARLANSAKIVGIKLPKSQRQIEKLVLLGIKKNKDLKELNIKIIVTGGISADSLTPGSASLIIIFTQATIYPKNYYQKGIKVITYKAKRNLPRAKYLNYFLGIMALNLARKKKAVEAIYTDEKGKLYEAITSNFFVVINNKLATPKNGVLLGITRKTVLELAKKMKISVAERNLYRHELGNFQEAFLTASNKEIMPVVKIDNRMIGNGKVGPITKIFMAEFIKITRTTSRDRIGG